MQSCEWGASVASRGVVGPGGAWTEKLLTLTLPHRPRDDTAAQIAFVRSAWPHFRRALYRWIAEHDPDADAVHWYATHEWTVGRIAKDTRTSMCGSGAPFSKLPR